MWTVYGHPYVVMGRPAAIMFYRCGFFLSSLFFPLTCSVVQIGCVPYFHTLCSLSVSLECRSEMCCMRLAENAGHRNSPSMHHHTTLSFFTAEGCSDKPKKNLLNSNISSTCPDNLVNFGPLTAESGWQVWGTPANFNGFYVLALLLHRHRLTEANQTLYIVLPSPSLVHHI